jgi:hypothetical protein
MPYLEILFFEQVAWYLFVDNEFIVIVFDASSNAYPVLFLQLCVTSVSGCVIESYSTSISHDSQLTWAQ